MMAAATHRAARLDLMGLWVLVQGGVSGAGPLPTLLPSHLNVLCRIINLLVLKMLDQCVLKVPSPQ